jgi:hypothetical protein
LEALKQTEHCASILPDSHDPDRDRDTEVAHTILRLSDNSHLDSYPNPSGNQQGSCHHMNNLGPLVHGHAPMASGYGIFDGYQQHMSSNAGNVGFPQNFTNASPTSLIGDGTGWGELDSFVSTTDSCLRNFFFQFKLP